MPKSITNYIGYIIVASIYLIQSTGAWLLIFIMHLNGANSLDYVVSLDDTSGGRLYIECLVYEIYIFRF